MGHREFSSATKARSEQLLLAQRRACVRRLGGFVQVGFSVNCPAQASSHEQFTYNVFRELRFRGRNATCPESRLYGHVRSAFHGEVSTRPHTPETGMLLGEALPLKFRKRVSLSARPLWGFKVVPRGPFMQLISIGAGSLSKPHYQPLLAWCDAQFLFRLESVVPELNIARLARQVNRDSSKFLIGRLQLLRKEFRRGSRASGSAIFSSSTTFKDHAFHHGGRTELQFNIGVEGDRIRYGVAFSLQLSRALTSLDSLLPKIELFNEFVTENTKALRDLQMWHYAGARSPERAPTPITEELIREGVFIFLGTAAASREVTSEAILTLFDRLLPLYVFVQSNGKAAPTSIPSKGFRFRPGFRKRVMRTRISRTQAQLSVELREALVQKQLYAELCEEYNAADIGTEIPNGIGGFIDVVRKTKTGYVYYELKAGRLLQGCIREAIGQLLEYSLWPTTQPAEELVIVGEASPDNDGRAYLDTLKQKFCLPLLYRQVECPRV